jgi:hypothetical protein
MIVFRRSPVLKNIAPVQYLKPELNQNVAEDPVAGEW